MKFLKWLSQLFFAIILTSLFFLPLEALSDDPPSHPAKSEAKGADQWEIISHHISAELDLKEHLLKATDLMILQPGKEDFTALINSAMNIHFVRLTSLHRSDTSSSFSGDDMEFSLTEEYDLSIFYPVMSEDVSKKYENASLLRVKIPEACSRSDGNIQLLISYAGNIYVPPRRAEFSRENIADQTTGLIGEEGIYLSEATHWYPARPKALSTFKLKVTLPEEYEVVSEGDFHGKTLDQGLAEFVWDVPYPTEALHLIGGKYAVSHSSYNGIDVSTYFFPEEQPLSESYIKAVKKYLQMYEEMIGEYPYKKFSVVENFFPTGYGMPSLTLLGRQVIKLPFIIHTSLGHEVLHNWWGNSVFVDYEKGNWCEGLTTYMADYHYKELQSPEAAEQYRREICRDYTNYVVQSGEDFPLTAFRERTTPATRAIGYGKTLMLFHMLRTYLGDEVFFSSLREFNKRKVWSLTSWLDLEQIFEEKSGKDLTWFFDQWVNRSGAPMLKLKKPYLEQKDNHHIVKIELEQLGKPFQMTVPIEIQLENRKDPMVLSCSFPGKTPSLNRCQISSLLEAKPLSISVDPHQELFRKLFPEEIPAILSGVLGDKDQLVVLLPEEDESLTEAYSEMAANLTRTGKAKRKNLNDVIVQDLQENSLFILGNILKLETLKGKTLPLPNDLFISKEEFILNGKKYSQEASLLYTLKNPWNKDKTVALFAGQSAKAVKAAVQKLFHYGKYSYLVFQSGENQDKGVHAVQSSPLIYRFD